jgi:hypothetical protein
VLQTRNRVGPVARRRCHYSQEVISRNLEPTDRWAQPSVPSLRHQLAYVFLGKRKFDLAERAVLDAISMGPAQRE